MLSGVLAFSQNRVVTGTVSDEKGNPIESASIVIVGSKSGTTTDQNGNYRLQNVPSNASIKASLGGVAPVSTNSGDKSVVNFTINRSTQLVEVIVNTTLGRRTSAAKLGTGISTISGKELTQAAPINLANGLTGKVAGLSIANTNSGVLGQNRITFRGIRSLTGNNQPMLVVDGAQVSLDFLNSINPNDVESTSLLKSGSATTVYGPDGVNGAIIITTKRGKISKPSINFSQSIQFEKVSYLPKFQDKYGSGYAQDADGNGTFEPIEQQSWGPEFDGSIRQFGQTGPKGEKLFLPYSYQSNGRRSFFQTGVTNQTDISYSMGDFFLSAQNASVTGTIPDDVKKRKTISLRAEKSFNQFKASFSAHYTNTRYDITSANSTVYYGITSAPGQYNLSRFSDWRNDYFSSPDGYYTTYLDNNGKTPYFAKDNNREIGKNDELFGNAELQYKASDWLTFTYRLGGTIGNLNTENTRGAYQRSDFSKTLRDPQSRDITSAFSAASAYTNRLTSELFATANKRFKKFGTDVLLGYSYRQSNTRFQSIGSGNLGFSPFLSIASRLGEADVSNSKTKTTVDRIFGTVGFDWDQKVFVQGTFSSDRDSRLSPPVAAELITNKQISLFYPGVNASILVHKLIPALQNSKVINNFKIRGTISKTGNVNQNPFQNDVTFGAGTFFPYGSTPGFTQSQTFNPRTIKPEFVLDRNVGIELGFLKNRITFVADYYNQKNADQILGLQVSNTTGFTQTVLNAASFVNRGYEFDLKLTPLINLGGVDIDIKANYTRQESEILSLVDGVNELGIGNYNFAIVGQSAFKFKLPDYKRDNQGRVIVGADGMPSINPNETVFGKTAPDNIFGLTVGLTWKNISFAAVGEYRGGNQIVVDQLGQFLDDNGISERSAQYGRRAFVFPNSSYEDAPGSGKYVANTDRYTQRFGRLFFNDDINTNAITNYLADGSFWKLREVSLSYSMPNSILKGKAIKAVNFAITGRNLLMWVPKSNVWTDPEFTSNGNAAYTGNAVGRSTAFNLPPTRNFGVSLSLQF